MEKKKIFSILLILAVILIFFCVVLLPSKKEETKEKNNLYSRRFDKTILKFQKYDDVLGQNMVVGVEKSTNHGKSYTKITKEAITVSQEARFLFVSKSVGYVISTGYIMRNNDFKGFKVTLDGGKTFTDAKFYYENERVDLITIEDFPYRDSDGLKLECSVYDVAEDGNGYEDKKIEFHSSDKGLTWYFIYPIDKQKNEK